jgi:hypothetical protein
MSQYETWALITSIYSTASHDKVQPMRRSTTESGQHKYFKWKKNESQAI